MKDKMSERERNVGEEAKIQKTVTTTSNISGEHRNKKVREIWREGKRRVKLKSERERDARKGTE